MSELRVNVTQGPGPGTWFGDARDARAILDDGDGQVAEVQLARMGGDLVVIVAGLWGHTVNDRGHLIVTVAPTPGKSSGPGA
jgi:hypothetical protein